MTLTIPASIIGTTAGPIIQTVDARWLMAYAAALGETDPRYFDTLGAAGPLAHPMFPVCYEWAVAVAMREKTLDETTQRQSVHATHHLTIHRIPRAGDMLSTSARVLHVAPRRAGTLVVTRFETTDASGNRVTTTDYGSVYRGVALAGTSPVVDRERDSPGEGGGVGDPSDRTRPRGGSEGSPTPPPSPGAPGSRWTTRVEVPANAAWVYTECARIWNPIHTDVGVAQAAGLSAPILHGTATLALAVSRVISHDLGGDPRRVREVRGRFTGMVPMPSTLTVRGRDAEGPGVAFDAVGPGGASVLGQGVLIP